MILIYFQLDSGFGGICAIEPLHTGHGDDIDILIGVTNNSIVEGSLNVPFHPVVQVCEPSGSDLEEALIKVIKHSSFRSGGDKEGEQLQKF